MHVRTVSGQLLRSATFGCVPVSGDDATRAHLNDLCEALSEALELTIRSHRAPSPAALANAYQAGRVHVIWSSPVLAATSHHLEDAIPLARSLRDNAASYYGVLFTRADSRIRHLSQLEGTRVAWVARSSASSYLFMRLALAREGLDPNRVFAEEDFMGSHGGVVEAVDTGVADVGATFAVFEKGDPRRPLARAGFANDGKGKEAYRILCVSDPIPSDIVLASPAFVRTVRADPAEVLCGIHSDPRAAAAIKHVLGADAFGPVDLGQLEELRERFTLMRLGETA